MSVPERDLLITQGLQAADAALREHPDDPDTLTVKALLLRLRAAQTPEAGARDKLNVEADAVAERAIAARKRRWLDDRER